MQDGVVVGEASQFGRLVGQGGEVEDLAVQGEAGALLVVQGLLQPGVAGVELGVEVRLVAQEDHDTLAPAAPVEELVVARVVGRNQAILQRYIKEQDAAMALVGPPQRAQAHPLRREALWPRRVPGRVDGEHRHAFGKTLQGCVEPETVSLAQGVALRRSKSSRDRDSLVALDAAQDTRAANHAQGANAAQQTELQNAPRLDDARKLPGRLQYGLKVEASDASSPRSSRNITWRHAPPAAF